jgi:hypothetical protein
MMPLLADGMGAERLLQSCSLRLVQNDPKTERLRCYQREPSAFLNVLKHRKLELVAGLASAECEDPGGFDGEHDVQIYDNSLFVFIVEVKIPVAYLEWPASIPLGRPHRG